MGPLRNRGRTGHRSFRHRSAGRMVLTALLAVGAGGLAASAVNRAEATRAAYGEAVAVPVAVRDLAAGTTVTAADVEQRDLPVAVVPDGHATDPVGRVVRDPVIAGEVVLDARLGGAGGGAAALLGPGRRAVAVPVDERSLALAVGDHVDVLAPDDRINGGSGTSRASWAGASRVARNAEVLAVDDFSVTLGVLAGEAPAVARAVLDGAVALALVGAAP